MPLLMAKPGEVNIIAAVRGKNEIRRHLENMGFVEGAKITIVAESYGNLIVSVKDARVALSKNLASKIYI